MGKAGTLIVVALAATGVGFLLGHFAWPPQAPPGRVVRVEMPVSPPPPPRPPPGAPPLPQKGFRPAGGPAPGTKEPEPPPQPQQVELPGTDAKGGRAEGETVDGRCEGLWRTWFKEGGLASEVNYRGGVTDGEASYYHRTGGLRQRGTYRNGLKEGLWQMWDEDGNLVREEEWRSNVIAAPVRIFDPKGEWPPEAEALQKASVDGKYRNLLAKVAAPDDRNSYGEFRDYGRWDGTSYMGDQSIPQGYWVYVWPYWYVWGDAVSAPK